LLRFGEPKPLQRAWRPVCEDFCYRTAQPTYAAVGFHGDGPAELLAGGDNDLLVDRLDGRWMNAPGGDSFLVELLGGRQRPV